MSHPSFPLAVIGIALCCGVLLSNSCPFQINPYPLLAISLGLLFICHLKRWKLLFWIFTMCCFGLLGTLRFSPLDVTPDETPKTHYITIKKRHNTNSYGNHYIVSLKNKELALLQTATKFHFAPGDRFLVYGRCVPISSPKNPGDFDFKQYMLRKGVSQKIHVIGDHYKALTPEKSMLRISFKTQQLLISQLKKTQLSSENKALIMALVLGNKNELSEERLAQYQRAGAMHLLAISGLHVGVLLVLLRFVVNPLKRLRYGNVLAGVLPILFLWGFALLTGGSPSVLRAVTMFSFLQLGLALNRKNAAIQGVWASFIVLLIINPKFVFDVGFQLSYAAVFGIVWMMPYWQRIFVSKKYGVRYIATLIGLGGIAQLSVLPLALYYFHQFPLLFWLSNLVLVPLLGIILCIGIGCVVISFIPSLYFLLKYADVILKSYQWIVTWIAQWEQFFISNIPFRAEDALVLSSAIIALFMYLQRLKTNTFMLFGVLSLLFHAQLYWDWKKPPKALILNTYKNSVLITTANKKGIAFIANKTAKALKLVDQIQQHYRLNTLDILPLKQAYTNLLVIDNTGVYKGLKPYNAVWLRESPKIHLEALIDSIHPQVIIADGSNYPSFIKRWKKTCAVKGVAFYATTESGAYSLN